MSRHRKNNSKINIENSSKMAKKNTSQLSIQKFLVTSPRKSSLSKQDNTPSSSTSNTPNKSVLSKKVNNKEKSKFRNAVLSPKLKLKSSKKKRLTKEEKKKKKNSDSQQLSLLSFFSPAYHLLKKISSPFKNEKNGKSNSTDSAIEMEYSTTSKIENTEKDENEPETEDYIMVDDEIEEDDIDDVDDYDYDEFDPFDFIRSLPPLDPYRDPILPPKPADGPAITLVLDLDETLVHCTTAEMDEYDVMFPVELNGQQFQVSGRYRPYCAEFLEKVAEKFEVIIFTASQKVYANTLLDFMDPTHKLISHRLFRDECVTVYGNYLKDLSVLGRDLSQTIIIDNSIYAFGYQLENGIPITSWYSDKDDKELLTILEFLESLIGAYDVRPYLKDKYKLIDRANAAYSRYASDPLNDESSETIPHTPSKIAADTTTASFITSSPKQKSAVVYNK